jgi:hypothetical protein
MFEPENDIERLLVHASAEPAERPRFARALMDAEVFVVLVPEGGRIPPGVDGKTVIPQGTKLSMPGAMRGQETLIPFFTSPSRAKAWFAGDHVVAPDRTRDLFERHPGAPFVLNPNSDYGKDFTPAEVTRLLAGEYNSGPQTVTASSPQQVLLAHPKEIPAALIEALAREFDALPSVRGAWLMLATYPGQSEQSWILGVDHQGPWPDVREAIGRVLAGDILGGRTLDALPLEGSSLAATLRTGILVTAARRGPLH